MPPPSGYTSLTLINPHKIKNIFVIKFYSFFYIKNTLIESSSFTYVHVTNQLSFVEFHLPPESLPPPHSNPRAGSAGGWLSVH